MITITIPGAYEPECRYVLKVIFTEFFGLDISIEIGGGRNIIITMNEKRELVVASHLFSTPADKWLTPVSLPKQPLSTWNLGTSGLNAVTVKPNIPVIYGDDPNQPGFFQLMEDKIYLGLDIFGSAFFMLTRYEEVVKTERDQHERFPATASLAYQEGFLDRPIINEYLEILWACLKRLWPRLERKPSQFETHVSHDVDEPYLFAFKDFLRLTRLCAGDLLKRKSFRKAIDRIPGWLKVKAGDLDADPYNTFDLIMDISERHNLRSAFYFIADHSSSTRDGEYDIHHPLMTRLIKKIHQRGHEIGLHASYNTYRDAVQTKKEFEILQQVCNEQGIEQKRWGGRQHYLRWETPTTFQNWEEAGLDYDSSLTYADVAGFRCGVCYEFPTFNVKSRKSLKLRERPLIIMEGSVLDKRYMNIGIGESAIQTIKKYQDRCRPFNGDFTFLWHNTFLSDEREITLYQNIISQI